MSIWLKYVDEEPPKPPPPKESKILSGIVYQHPHLKNIFYHEDELIFKTNYKHIDSNLDEREPLPTSPLSIYKDDQKNDQLNAFWIEMNKSGVIACLEQENAFRVAKIRLINDAPLYPITLSKGTPGFVYHDSYLDIFPAKYSHAWKPKLLEGYKLVILKKLPWMIKKDKFMVEQATETDQMSLL